ncbi:MAG: hypothetical protein Tsb0013_09930 [Phycisphaerales bacterium]
MAPQFVDFNADGFIDIVTGTYDGSPHVSYGSAIGFSEPTHVLDRDGNRMVMGMYFDQDNGGWTMDEGGHCTSAAAFDWDADGDFDLLMGDYNQGLLMLRLNEGTNEKPAFATQNTQVMIGEEPFKVKGGMSAPQLIDWDGDGLTDIITGGMQEGGVYLYRNTGKKGAPEFAPPITLLEAEAMPTVKTEPNSGCYVFAHDLDDDGDLDLLVGGYAVWTPEREPLTPEQEERLKELKDELESLNTKIDEVFAAVQEQAGDDYEKLAELMDALWEDNEELGTIMQLAQDHMSEIAQLEGQPERSAGVWMYRRK